jgi:hypothetical protein
LQITPVLPLHAIFFPLRTLSLTLFLKLFKRMLDQFDRLRKRNAFLEQYKKEKMFEHGLEEFDDARQALPAFGTSFGLIYLYD